MVIALLTLVDKSVLENYHTAYVFKLMAKDKMNFIKEVETQQKKSFRALIIETILATDMQNHFSQHTHLKNRLASSSFDPSGEDKQIILN